MKNLSIIQNLNEVVDTKSLELILTEIRTGYYRDMIIKLQRHLSYGELGHYENLKKKLPTFTPSGVFKWDGKQYFLQRYSNYVLLDTPKIPYKDLSAIYKKLISNPFVLAAFKSPSGCSFKILVEVSTAFAYHVLAHNQVREYFAKILSIHIIDTSRNLAQLCYVSHDPILYQNPNHQIFHVQIPEEY